MSSMPYPLKTLHLPRSVGSGEGHRSLMFGTKRRHTAFSASGDAGRMRQAVGIVPPRREKRQAWLQPVEEPFLPRPATAMIGKFEERHRLRQPGSAQLLESLDHQISEEQHPFAANCRMHDNGAIVKVLSGLSCDKQTERGFAPPVQHRPPFRQGMHWNHAALQDFPQASVQWSRVAGLTRKHRPGTVQGCRKPGTVVRMIVGQDDACQPADAEPTEGRGHQPFTISTAEPVKRLRRRGNGFDRPRHLGPIRGGQMAHHAPMA